MATYDVYAPPRARGITDPAEKVSAFGDRYAFIRDGLSPLAFVFPAAWFLLHGLFLGFAVYLVVAAGVFALVQLMNPDAGLFLLALFNFLIGAEASRIKRLSYRLTGWEHQGAVIAQKRTLAAARYYDAVAGTGVQDENAEPAGPPAPPTAQSSGVPARRVAKAGPYSAEVIGLFPARERPL